MHVLERISERTTLIIDFGGGVKQENDLKVAFESGARMVTGGSIAVKDPESFIGWVKKYGSDKIILGADVKENMSILQSNRMPINAFWKESQQTDLAPTA